MKPLCGAIRHDLGELVAIGGLDCERGAMPKRPNVLVICTDQQRPDSLGCYGNEVIRSPHLDSLASRGTLFRSHTTPNQICSPSRATMFTGLLPRNHGLTANGQLLLEHVPVLPRLLADAGYQTYAAGKLHIAPELSPLRYGIAESRDFWHTEAARGWRGPYYGFQQLDLVIGLALTSVDEGHYGEWIRAEHPESRRLILEEEALVPTPSDLEECWKSAMPADVHYNTWIFDRGIDFLNRAEPPFFCYVSTPDPHHPFTPPHPYCDMFNPSAVPAPSVVPDELDLMPDYVKIRPPADVQALDAEFTEQGALLPVDDVSDGSIRLAIAHTYGLVAMIDDNVGRMLAALDARGLTEETIVVFTSDHGELLGDHGLMRKGPPPYRALREIALLMSGPGIMPGQRVNALSDHVDVTPTLLDLAGLDMNGLAFDGVSLRPALGGRANGVRRERFAEYHAVLLPEVYNQTIETREWRLTVYPHHSTWGELFDLSDDPGEHRNLFHDSSMRERIESMRQRLLDVLPPHPKGVVELIAKY